ncbi:uncharacterized protein LOC109812650 [Cajanus cajan]|uniref:uncharacterized protein LOC109812650 n=1 Tax=Cajanus cajan TaxID=3821 RepID=UPI00098DB984|nr:uncharacterized protein LOC109812650 [Cajanus cajan]
MLIYGPSLSMYCGSWVRVGGIQSAINWQHRCSPPKKLSGSGRRCVTCKFQSVRVSRACSVALTTLLATAVVIASVAAADEPETLSNIPQTLSGECTLSKDCKKARIQKPRSRNAESCTSKCVTTCIRGGEGSPGEGPFNVIRPLVVFKQGFRTRQYCLVECSDICNLISDAVVTKAR